MILLDVLRTFVDGEIKSAGEDSRQLLVLAQGLATETVRAIAQASGGDQATAANLLDTIEIRMAGELAGEVDRVRPPWKARSS